MADNDDIISLSSGDESSSDSSVLELRYDNDPQPIRIATPQVYEDASSPGVICLDESETNNNTGNIRNNINNNIDDYISHSNTKETERLMREALEKVNEAKKLCEESPMSTRGKSIRIQSNRSTPASRLSASKTPTHFELNRLESPPDIDTNIVEEAITAVLPETFDKAATPARNNSTSSCGSDLILDLNRALNQSQEIDENLIEDESNQMETDINDVVRNSPRDATQELRNNELEEGLERRDSRSESLLIELDSPQSDGNSQSVSSVQSFDGFAVFMRDEKLRMVPQVILKRLLPDEIEEATSRKRARIDHIEPSPPLSLILNEDSSDIDWGATTRPKRKSERKRGRPFKNKIVDSLSESSRRSSKLGTIDDSSQDSTNARASSKKYELRSSNSMNEPDVTFFPTTSNFQSSSNYIDSSQDSVANSKNRLVLKLKLNRDKNAYDSLLPEASLPDVQPTVTEVPSEDRDENNNIIEKTSVEQKEQHQHVITAVETVEKITEIPARPIEEPIPKPVAKKRKKSLVSSTSTISSGSSITITSPVTTTAQNSSNNSTTPSSTQNKINKPKESAKPTERSPTTPTLSTEKASVEEPKSRVFKIPRLSRPMSEEAPKSSTPKTPESAKSSKQLRQSTINKTQQSKTNTTAQKTSKPTSVLKKHLNARKSHGKSPKRAHLFKKNSQQKQNQPQTPTPKSVTQIAPRNSQPQRNQVVAIPTNTNSIAQNPHSSNQVPIHLNFNKKVLLPNHRINLDQDLFQMYGLKLVFMKLIDKYTNKYMPNAHIDQFLSSLMAVNHRERIDELRTAQLSSTALQDLFRLMRSNILNCYHLIHCINSLIDQPPPETSLMNTKNFNIPELATEGERVNSLLSIYDLATPDELYALEMYCKSRLATPERKIEFYFSPEFKSYDNISLRVSFENIMPPMTMETSVFATVKAVIQKGNELRYLVRDPNCEASSSKSNENASNNATDTWELDNDQDFWDEIEDRRLEMKLDKFVPTLYDLMANKSMSNFKKRSTYKLFLEHKKHEEELYKDKPRWADYQTEQQKPPPPRGSNSKFEIYKPMGLPKDLFEARYYYYKKKYPDRDFGYELPDSTFNNKVTVANQHADFNNNINGVTFNHNLNFNGGIIANNNTLNGTMHNNSSNSLLPSLVTLNILNNLANPHLALGFNNFQNNRNFNN